VEWFPFFANTAPRIVLAAAALVFPLLFFIPAPYGRHYRPGFGPSLPARLGWVVMESPSLVLFAALWWTLPERFEPSLALLAALWLTHYAERTLIFSALMRGEGRRKPWLTVGMAIVFNVLNAGGNALSLAPRTPDGAYVFGVALFVVGMAINLHSDAVLRHLRAPGETGYRVPHGGFFRWVSSPNYFGEMIEWLGFALAAGTLASWAFFAFTVANLLPRAISHHRWYRERFPDYPGTRRALIPFVL
jgi:protein-S-isoprenylcysteine O-methyltransferase Ste14